MRRDETLRGHCLCGEVSYEAPGPTSEMWYCHCRECRKSSGAGFGSWLETGSVRWLSGEEGVVRFSASRGLTRSFCASCGTVLPALLASGGALLPASGLDSAGTRRPVCHAFVAERAPWLPVCGDELPAFAGQRRRSEVMRGGFEAMMAPARAANKPVHGSCLCGEIAWTAAPPLSAMRVCHCSRCRRRSGSSWFAGLACAAGSLAFVRGEDGARGWHMPGTRFYTVRFCSDCGAGVPSVLTHATFLSAGTLDSDPGIRARCHIYYGSRAPWVSVHDGLPCFEESAPPDFNWR